MATMANNPITLDKLLHASKTLMKLKTETDSEYVRRLTHAALTECGITRIVGLLFFWGGGWDQCVCVLFAWLVL